MPPMSPTPIDSESDTEGSRDAPKSAARALALPIGLGVVGLLGLAPGVAGAFDPVTLLAWLVLVAPACGVLAGASGVRLWPAGLIPPALWAALLVQAELASERHLPTPSYGMAVPAGLFFAGLALGARLPARPVALAGGVLFFMLLASGLGVRGTIGAADAAFARSHPRVATALLELSPLVLAFECAGVDYAHMQPDVYARSTIEWFPRRPYDGALAGPVVLLVGSVLACLTARARRARNPHVRS